MAVYEVMFLDHYDVQDSSKRLDLIGRLRDFAGIEHDEMIDSQLSSFLWSAAKLFNPEITSWEEIQPIEEYGLLLWSSMSVADERMMASAKYFPIDSRVGKTDPSVRVRNNIEIKKALRQQFEDYLNDNAISIGDPGILQGELVRRDMLTDLEVPADTQSAPPKTTAQLIAKTDVTVDLRWIQSPISDFYRYLIYYDTGPNLKDITRLAEATNAGIREDATLAGEITDQWDYAARVTGLTANTAYWFVIVVEDLNGRVSISNEIVAQTEA